MPNQKTPADWKDALKQSVETLAMQVVMEEDLAEPCRSLESIRSQAEQAGHKQLAGIAASLLRAISEAGAGQAPGSRPPAELISNGVWQLQQALEAAGGGAAGTPDSGPPDTPQNAGTSASRAGSLAQDAELLGDFILESREHLAAIENNLLAVEQDPKNLGLLHSVFRGFHTIKGLAGFLELAPIQEAAHHVETILDLARNERLAITPEVIDLVLRGADYLKAAIDRVDAALRCQGQAQIPDNHDLIRRIHEMVAGESEPDYLGRLNGAVSRADESSRATPEPNQRPAPKALSETSGAPAAQAIKVDTARLDHLVDMVGEMVIAQSLLRHDPDWQAIQSPRLQRSLSQVGGITSDIQKTAMALRMVTVRQLFQRTGRFVRDLARKAAKQVELVTSGEDTELDRQIVEELTDPLMHMVRNSIDHGLEKPDERVAAGKDPVGRISLTARHQAGMILVEVADDGRGLDREKILAKAREKGLIGPENHLSDNEVLNLIFEPGFSTAERVTDVSGRGVGLDVVKKNITRLRGRVEVVSVAGRGATFLLRLPLTLAIIDGLVVAVGRERYILPIHSVLEMLRPAREAVSTIENKGEMVLVRGSLLPIIKLHQRFGVVPRSQDTA